MKITSSNSIFIQTIAAGLTGIGLIVSGAVSTPAQTTQQFSCTGRMNSGWNYDAKFLNGRFTEIAWSRSGQPSQVSSLTFQSANAQGQPIYRGSFQAATAVTLVDLGRGNVRPGSQVSIGVEEWGWSRGTCFAAVATPPADWFTDLRQNLVGSSGDRSREWMRSNGYIFDRTVQHTDTQAVERWMRSADNSRVDVVIASNNVVTEVRRVP